MILIAVQARMGSTRLPGKCMLKVLGRPLISYLLERLKRVRGDILVAVLTTTLKRDDCLAEEAAKARAEVFRGSEEHVLERYTLAARSFGAQAIVRITADCPLIDPLVIDTCLEAFTAGRYDYFSNTLQRTFPRGMDTEIFTRESLEVAYASARQMAEREHVTPYIYHHPERFKLGGLAYSRNLSRWRWTVDTPEDFALVSRLLAAAYARHPAFTFEELIHLAEEHPDWMQLNAHIEQKQV